MNRCQTNTPKSISFVFIHLKIFLSQFLLHVVSFSNSQSQSMNNQWVRCISDLLCCETLLTRMQQMFCFKMVRTRFLPVARAALTPFFLVSQGHGVSSDTTGQTIVEPNSNEHYLGLVNVGSSTGAHSSRPTVSRRSFLVRQYMLLQFGAASSLLLQTVPRTCSKLSVDPEEQEGESLDMPSRSVPHDYNR